MMFRSVGSKLITRSFNRNGFVRFLSANQRPPSNDFSLDLNFVASHPDLVKAHLNARHSSEDIISQVDKISELRQQRKELIVKGDRARNKRKTLSKEIGALMSQGKKDAVDYLKQEVELATREAQTAEQEQVGIEAEIEEVLLHLPNLVDDRVPYGFDDSENKIVSIWGEDKRKIGEEFKWHDEIAKDLGGLDMEAASKLSGSRFSVLIGDIAKLERALTQYFVDFHTSRGYTEVSVPFIVSHSTLRGTGQLPKFEDDLFKVNHSVGGEDAFLIPTSEVPVTNLFRDTILQADQLPISLVALSPCFRAEAGSGGKDSRGLLRQHQFLKVELVKICRPEDSRQEHERLTNDAEDLLKSLELPYRKVLLCSGDLGFAARICYDLEVWLPGQNNYREISSCSNCYDFQARRMKLRYKASQKQNEFCHTLNGSGVAVGRALVAILENYQEADGSVVIPEVLRPYMGGLTKLVPKKDKSNFPYKK